MDFDNQTRFPAMLMRGVIGEDRMTASALARVTYDIDRTGLVPSDGQLYIVSPEPWECPHGTFEQDQVFKTGGVDLFVFGRAYAPGGRPTITMIVSVIVGDFRCDVQVFGARTWERRGGRLVATPPARFTEVPLSLANAYGGKATWDELEMPWPDNGEGVGFYVEEQQAEGNPLPQLEDPAHLIRSWDDRPIPAGLGFCPLTNGARMKAAVVMDEKYQLQEITPRLYNRAHPAMVAPSVAPGTQVVVIGVTPAGRLEFRLPERLPQARLQLGERIVERPFEIDQVGIDVEARVVFVTFRFPFRYQVIPEQQRSLTLAYQEA